MEEQVILANIPRDEINLPIARELLNTLRLVQAEFWRYDRRTVVHSDLGLRAQALRYQVVKIPPHIVRQLTEAEQNEREEAMQRERSNIIDMRRLILGDDAGPNRTNEVEVAWLEQWQNLVREFYVHDVPRDIIWTEMFFWTGVALLRLGFLAEDLWIMTWNDHQALADVYLTMTRRIQNQLGSGFLTPSEEAELREVLEDLPAATDLEFVLGMRDENEDEVQDDYRDVARMDGEMRTSIIMAIYPEAPLESLPEDQCTCQICGEGYGAEYDDKQACQPRNSACCPPAKMGSDCLIEWLVRSSNHTCPVCRVDLRPNIRNMALMLELPFLGSSFD